MKEISKEAMKEEWKEVRKAGKLVRKEKMTSMTKLKNKKESENSGYEYGEVVKQILIGLAVGGFIAAVMAAPNLAQLIKLFNAHDRNKRKTISQTANRLQKQKLVRWVKRNGEDVLEITEKGRKKVLKYKFDDIKIHPQKKWDGYFRVVIFDIPETKKRVRRAINFKLKELGMMPIQKSTFISPWECRSEIDFVGEFYFVRKHISYMLVKDIDNKDKLKKIFNLK